ncbi:hypothetical protein PDK27_00330 [Bacillus cereus group sp. TH230-1LC]|nr:hypothetical protein [Bacillus cereus group sp. TH230-1LC]
MYFCKVPISLFNSQKTPETIYSILQFHFNKTLNCTDEIIYKERFTDLTPEKTFYIPSPVFTEEKFGTIKAIDLIIYAHLCRDAYLTNTGKVKVNISTISQETLLKKTIVRSSINLLLQKDLIIKDSHDGYYIIEDLFYYFTDKDFKNFINIFKTIKA